jgi:nucleobase:cation symporter-1, NCS1 family
VFAVAAIVSVVVALVPALGTIAPFSWFIGAGIAGALYWALGRSASPAAQAEESRANLRSGVGEER